MKKVLVGVVVLIIVGGYFWWSLRGSSSSVPVQMVSTTTTSTVSSNPTTSATTTTTTTTTTASTGYKDGTYTGTVSSAVYGPVQVAVTITGGKIAAVNVLQYPDAPGHSSQVSETSLPILKQEVIAAQSANVDTVSGATQTSEAFNQSLSSALSQAS